MNPLTAKLTVKFTSQDLRERLPGYEIETVLVSQNGKQLLLITEISGCIDELIAKHSFRIINGDKKYFFHTLNDAKNAWDLLDTWPQNMQYIRILT
jgi:hypothetical protein